MIGSDQFQVASITGPILDSNESLFGYAFNGSATLPYTKNEIDGFIFRMMNSGSEADPGKRDVEHGLLENLTHDQLRDKKNSLGFQPGDIDTGGGYKNGGHGFYRSGSVGNYTDAGNIRTKTEFDI